MDTNKILQSDYLDILYDGRNKKYGGYELRRSYEKRMRVALGSLFTVSALFSGYVVIANSIKRNPVTVRPVEVIHELKDIQTVQPPPPPPPPPPPVRPAIQWTVPKIVENKSVPEDEKPPEVDKLANLDIGLRTIDGDSNATPLPITTGTVAAPQAKKNEIPVYVSQMPEAPYDVNAYLGKMINYPAYARENNIEGTLYVRFVVSEDGSITDVEIAGKRRLGGGLEEEALRVISAAPKWRPGRENGNPVKVYYTLPVTFVLH